MKPITPIQQVDIVLFLLKNDRGHINFDDILTRLVILPSLENPTHGIDGDVLLRILQKLEKDNYIYTKQPLNGGLDYAITVEGHLFQGYEKQIKQDNSISRNRRIRTFALAWGTVLAGIAASFLLAWQVYSYYHPMPSPCDVIKTTK